MHRLKDASRFVGFLQNLVHQTDPEQIKRRPDRHRHQGPLLGQQFEGACFYLVCENQKVMVLSRQKGLDIMHVSQILEATFLWSTSRWR